MSSLNCKKKDLRDSQEEPYCQAWSLVWDEEPLFYELIEAWASGPVVREVFEEHRNMFNISQTSGDPSKLSAKQIETIEGVLSFYGDKPSQWLSDLTHRPRFLSQVE